MLSMIIDAIRMTQNIVENLNRPEENPSGYLKKPEEPAYDIKEIYGILSKDPRKPFEYGKLLRGAHCRRVRFHEFKAYMETTH